MGIIRFIEILPEDRRPEPRFKVGEEVVVDIPLKDGTRLNTPGVISSSFYSLDGRKPLYIVGTADGKIPCDETELKPALNAQEQGEPANE